METPKAIATDFDVAVARHQGGFEYIYELFTRRGIARDDVVRLSRELSKTAGFSMERLIPLIKRELGIARLEREKDIFDEHRRALTAHLEVYPDAMRALWEWRRLRIPVHIVTKGDYGYQTRNITLLKIPYDFVHVVEPPDRKAGALRKMLARYGAPILFIDDRVKSELYDARLRYGAFPGLTEREVITVHIVRSEGPYGDDAVADHSHHEIRSYEEILPKFFGISE